MSGTNMAATGVSRSCLLIKLGPICSSMVVTLGCKSYETTSYLKAIMSKSMEKAFTGLGPVMNT